MSKESFDKLSHHVAEEYEAKGVSNEKAKAIGDATAAKVAREKHAKRLHFGKK